MKTYLYQIPRNFLTAYRNGFRVWYCRIKEIRPLKLNWILKDHQPTLFSQCLSWMDKKRRQHKSLPLPRYRWWYCSSPVLPKQRDSSFLTQVKSEGAPTNIIQSMSLLDRQKKGNTSFYRFLYENTQTAVLHGWGWSNCSMYHNSGVFYLIIFKTFPWNFWKKHQFFTKQKHTESFQKKHQLIKPTQPF